MRQPAAEPESDLGREEETNMVRPISHTLSLAPDKATFEQLVNARFRLHVDEERCVEIELTDLKQRTSQRSYEQFCLLFRAPADAPAEHRIYQLEHDATGAFELFLVAVGRPEGGILYEAVFNRRIGESGIAQGAEAGGDR